MSNLRSLISEEAAHFEKKGLKIFANCGKGQKIPITGYLDFFPENQTLKTLT